MSSISSGSGEYNGIKYKAKKKIETENEVNPEVAAKYASLVNRGSELIVKQNQQYYLLELEDNINISDLRKKIAPDNKNIVALNVFSAQEKQKVGSLFTPETLHSRKSLYDKTSEIISVNIPDEKKGFVVGEGTFSTTLSDENGFLVDSKADIRLDVSGKLVFTTERLNEFVNKELLKPNTHLDFQLSEKSGEWKIKLGLKTDSEEKLKQYISSALLGEDNSLRRKLLANLDTEEKLNNFTARLISGVEKKLNFDLPENNIEKVLTGDIDAQKHLSEIVKNGISKEYLEKCLKEEAGEYDKYIPDFIFSKIATYTEKYLKEKVDQFLQKNTTPEGDTSRGQFLKELYQTTGYAFSDVKLEKLKTSVSTNFSENKMQLDFLLNGLISSDKNKEKIVGTEDKIKLQGSFSLTSKGYAEVNNVSLAAKANLQTGEINKATVVAAAEALGNKNEQFLGDLITKERLIKIDGKTDFGARSEGVYDTVIKVGEFSESRTGISIKGVNASIEADFNDKTAIKFRSNEKLTVEKATLMANYEVKPGIKINELSLQNSKSKNVLSLEGFAAIVDLQGKTEIAAQKFDTGFRFRGEIDKKKLSLDIGQISASEFKLEAGLNPNNQVIFAAKGNKFSLGSLNFADRNTELKIAELSIKKGEGNVNLSKSGNFSGSGTDLTIKDLETREIKTSIKMNGKSSINADQGSFSVVAPGVEGKVTLKDKKQTVEFSGLAGEVRVNAENNRITYRATAKDSVFSLKLKEKDLNLEFGIPKDALATINLNDQTFEVKDKKGKVLQLSATVKDYSGKEIGKVKLQAEGAISGAFANGFSVNSPEKGINIEGRVKNNGEEVKFSGLFNNKILLQNNTLVCHTENSKPQKINVEVRNRSFELDAKGNADLKLKMFQDGLPLQLELDNNHEPFNLKFKTADKTTGKTDAEFETILEDKTGIALAFDNQSKKADLRFVLPGNAEQNKPGVTINGFVDTEKGQFRMNDLKIKALSEDDQANLTISKEGALLKDAKTAIDGGLSLVNNGIETPINLKGSAYIQNAGVTFADKNVSVEEFKFQGEMTNAKIDLKGGFDGKNKEATFNGTILSGQNAVSMLGKLKIEEFSAEKITLTGQSSIDLKIGNAPNQYFITGIKSFNFNLADQSNELFTAEFNLKSAKKENDVLKADNKLDLSSAVSLKRNRQGFELDLTGVDIKSADSLQATLSQTIMLMKQPQISTKLAEKGITTEKIERMSKQLNDLISTGKLHAAADLRIMIDDKFGLKEVAFSGDIKAIEMGMPVFRHTKEKGFSVEAKKNEPMLNLNNPVKVSGLINIKDKEPLQASAEINLNELIPKIIEKQFSHPDSPIKGKVAVKMEGNTIRLYDPEKNKFFGNQITFGLKDIDVKIKDNKVNVTVNVNLFDAIYDSVKFAFSDNFKIRREIKYLKDNLAAFAPKDVDWRKINLLELNQINIDLQELIKNSGTGAELSGSIELQNGKMTVPVKVNF